MRKIKYIERERVRKFLQVLEKSDFGKREVLKKTDPGKREALEECDLQKRELLEKSDFG